MHKTLSLSSIAIGCMPFGEQLDEEEAATLIEQSLALLADDTKLILDTARMYPIPAKEGISEQMIGRIMERRAYLKSRLFIATKANPWGANELSYTGLRSQVEQSLENLKVDKIDLLFLHAPDHRHPIDETLRALVELYNEGRFRYFGLSNYAAWQVIDIHHRLIEANAGFGVSVYEGMINALTRDVDRELVPALRAFNIDFWAYNVTAGGILTNKYDSFDTLPSEGRFEIFKNSYRNRYWRREVFEALESLRTVVNDANVDLVDAAHRWVRHHSSVAEQGLTNIIIIGVSKLLYLKKNVDASLPSSPPLPDAVVTAFNHAWMHTRHSCPSYFR